jgi:hypothetical protein
VGHRLIAAVTALISACGTESAGTIELVLSLPPSGDLRPSGMSTVAVGITRADGNENVTTTPLDGMRFDAGDVPLDEPIQLRVELRDDTNRLVAFGRVEETITPDRSEQRITIPVRKPIVYVSGDRTVGTIDPTFDAIDPRFQGAIAGTTNAIAFPVNGTDVAVITGSSLQRFSTADHKPVAGPIDVMVTGVTDAARVPGQQRVVVAGMNGIAVVDLEAATARLIAGPAFQRVAVGGNAEAGFTVYGLSGRVAPPTGMTGVCTGTGMVLAYPVDAVSDTPVMIAQGAFSDIAASADAVFGSNPCAGTVAKLGAGGAMMMVSGAAAIAVEGGRVWAAGSAPPLGGEGARIRVASMRLDGSDPQSTLLPGKAEVMVYDGDSKKELSLNIHADTLVPLDLAVLPGASKIALITRMDAHRLARFDMFGKVIPEMDAIVHDLVIADPLTGSILQRIRSRCFLDEINESDALFPAWSCIETAGSETPAGGETTPRAVGALYGGR